MQIFALIFVLTVSKSISYLIPPNVPYLSFMPSPPNMASSHYTFELFQTCYLVTLSESKKKPVRNTACLF